MGLINQITAVAADSLAGWFDIYARIRDKAGALVRPTSNTLQERVSEVVDWCEENDRPARIIILKPRQRGCSTISVAAQYRHLKKNPGRRGCVIGSGYKQGSNMLSIMGVYAKNDNWDLGGKCRVTKDGAQFSNGSIVDRLTANDPEAGRSGTYQVVLATEAARWAEQGVANAAEVMSGLLKTIGDESDTMVIIESTAAGAYGDYYDRYGKAVTLEEAKAGKPGYIKIFVAWFEFPDCVRDPELEQIYEESDLNSAELTYMAKWSLSLPQMAWFRQKLRDECNDDFNRFQQDYPSDEKTAFLTSGRGVFSSSGLEWQTDQARLKTPKTGVLTHSGGKFILTPTEEEEAIWNIWSEPRNGRKYLVSVDPMTGADQNGGDDPDSHGVKVLRAGHIDNNGQWHRTEVVASLLLYDEGTRRGNWYNIDSLASHVHEISQYYGNCIIVPEINMDRGMVELLKLEGANIYKREVFNKRTSETMEAYGWMTTTKTRGMIVSTLVKAIREAPQHTAGEGIIINCNDTIKECSSFVRKESGREEAAQGAHDDQVLALAIGLQCIGLATTYTEPRAPARIPPELRGLMSKSRKGGSNSI